MFRNSAGLLAEYANYSLRVDYIHSAPTLEETLTFLHNCGILEEIIKDSGDYERVNSCSISCTSGYSGRKDYWLMENKSIYGFPEASFGHHILHISCEEKLNQGIKCFGPDLALLLWEQFYDLTRDILNEEKYYVQKLTLIPSVYSAGKLPLDFTKARGEIEEKCFKLGVLIDQFMRESEACAQGTISFLKEGNKFADIPSVYLDKLCDITRNQISSLTEDDWNFIRLNIEAIKSNMIYGKRRRVARRVEENVVEEQFRWSKVEEQ